MQVFPLRDGKIACYGLSIFNIFFKNSKTADSIMLCTISVILFDTSTYLLKLALY